jgi:cytochrome b subunit of formate dehydrogenase
VRVTHWANAILLVGMIGSGLQIYGAFPFTGQRGGGRGWAAGWPAASTGISRWPGRS